MTDSICTNCQTPFQPGQVVCTKCGTLLFDPRASTVHIRIDPSMLRLRRKRSTNTGLLPGTGSLVVGFLVTLQIRGLVERLYFEDGTEIVLGRIDYTNPDLSRFDLTRYGGHERGVSREHAVLRYQDGKLSITDLRSANGTRVAGDRLLPNVARVLKDGDSIVLGSLTIAVHFDLPHDMETKQVPAVGRDSTQTAELSMPRAEMGNLPATDPAHSPGQPIQPTPPSPQPEETRRPANLNTGPLRDPDDPPREPK